MRGVRNENRVFMAQLSRIPTGLCVCVCVCCFVHIFSSSSCVESWVPSELFTFIISSICLFFHSQLRIRVRVRAHIARTPSSFTSETILNVKIGAVCAYIDMRRCWHKRTFSQLSRKRRRRRRKINSKTNDLCVLKWAAANASSPIVCISFFSSLICTVRIE